MNKDETLNKKYDEILKNIENGDINKYNKNINAYNKVKESNLFDQDYYFSNYDIPVDKKFSLLHYLDKGFKEGKNPSENLDGNEYLNKYSDVKRANFNPLVHYVLYGKNEGRIIPLSKHGMMENRFDLIMNHLAQDRNLQNINLLRNKINNGKKINVVFILPAMMFVYEELYHLFDSDYFFNVQIVLVPHRLGNSPNITEVSKNKYYEIFSYLKNRNLNVIDGFDFNINQGIDIESTCNPDIVFYTMPYMRIYPQNMKIDNLPPNILYAYIPYGEFIEDDLDDNLYNFGWNEKIWKIFCSTKEYYKNAAIKSPVGTSNVVLSGSARMDTLINYKPSEEDYEWIYDKKDNKKRIIWAPHHTLARPSMDEKVTYSTFDKNYEFFYEYAKNHPEIEWVLRPHPLLKEILTEVETYMKLDGIATKNFAEEYYFKWNSLPNARVHEGLNYVDLFATADAMITDCVSFKSEFLYANKPGLILKRDNVVYEGYKKTITDAWYVENGSDFEKITEFIEDVVINENDYLKDKREKIFKEEFDINLGESSKFIFKYIKNQLI